MRYTLIALLLIAGITTFGQKRYKPTIVVLDPNQAQYDTSLFDKIKEFTYQIEYTPQEEKHILDSLSKNEKNIQLMDIAEFHFRKQMDFASSFTLSLYGMLTYVVFGQTGDCIVIASHNKSEGTIEKLKTVAKKHSVQWVVNPVTLQTFIKDGNTFTTARIQVYDSNKNKIVLEKEYTGDTKNPGFELSCESGTLSCTINNVVNSCLHDILLTILGAINIRKLDGYAANIQFCVSREVTNISSFVCYYQLHVWLTEHG